MECRVEAGDLRHLGQQRAQCPNGSNGFGLVQRGQVRQRLQVVDHGVIEHDGSAVDGAAVNHSVANRFELTSGIDELLKFLRRRIRRPPLERPCGDLLRTVQDLQFEAARARIHYCDARGHRQPAMSESRDQSRTSGMSIKFSTTYSSCRANWSMHHCLSSAAPFTVRLALLRASITR